MSKLITILLGLGLGFAQVHLASPAVESPDVAATCSCCCSCGGKCGCVKPAGQDRPPISATATPSSSQTRMQVAGAHPFVAIKPVMAPATPPRLCSTSFLASDVPRFTWHCALLI